MTRNKKDENVRSVYFVSKAVADLVKYNGDRFKVGLTVEYFNRTIFL